MSGTKSVMVALSGGVDSAVAALLLKEAGYDIQCLHMTNWEDDGYCDSSSEFRDARHVCDLLGVPLHRVNFAAEYRERVFGDFLDELSSGRTPNPDVLCNREIKFGLLKRYAARLGAPTLATGHYARLESRNGQASLLKAKDDDKDQTYFLHAVDGAEFRDVLFPLGDYEKSEVRSIARRVGMPIADKKDSTGICFIGERPFASFLSHYIDTSPGPIRTLDGTIVGEHIGLPFYTLGQRQGLAIGGQKGCKQSPWYVAAKDPEHNVLWVVQGRNHPALMSDGLTAVGMHWIGEQPAGLSRGRALRCAAKTRYRQSDQPCTVRGVGSDRIEVEFDEPQRSVTPGQFVVLYDGPVCLGGARIEKIEAVSISDAAGL